jgi:hypothetical protein
MRVANRSHRVSLLKKESAAAYSGILNHNIDALNQYYTDYTRPYSTGDFDHLKQNMTPEKISIMIKRFSPFLTRSGPMQTINSITLSTLTSLERGLWYKCENDSLANYIREMESHDSLSVSTNVNARIFINVAFAKEYLLYIQMYGIPKDGLFDPVLLQSFL